MFLIYLVSYYALSQLKESSCSLLKTSIFIGGQRQNRTADPLFFRQVLYRLSYLAFCGDDGIRTRDLLRDRQA